VSRFNGLSPGKEKEEEKKTRFSPRPVHVAWRGGQNGITNGSPQQFDIPLPAPSIGASYSFFRPSSTLKILATEKAVK